MPISGLVLTLVQDASLRNKTLESLRQHSAMELGTAVENRLPIVVETPDSEADRHVWEWLHSLPGVSQVEIAVIHFENEHDPGQDETRRRDEHET